MKKECVNCAYYNTDRNEQPCCNCRECLNWEESEEKDNDR